MADYSFFSNKDCQYFPCHNNVDPENFNCLFCYCPLYALGSKCGGNFYYTEKGIKTEPVMRLHNSDFITGSVFCCKWTMDFPVNDIRKIRTVIFLTENAMHAEVFPHAG